MEPITHQQNAAALLAGEPARDAHQRRVGARGRIERNEAVVGEPELEQIAPAYIGLAQGLARTDAPGHQYDGRVPPLVECRGVVEPGPKHRGGPAVVLGGAEHGNGVGGRRLLTGPGD